MLPRLAKSIADMELFCPNLRFSAEKGSGAGWWIGELQPVLTGEPLLRVLDDIHHNTPVETGYRGELRHLGSCSATHHEHEWMQKLDEAEFLRPFPVSVRYTGGHDHPRCWVSGVNPGNAKHLWGDGSLCPFMASEDYWAWHTHTVADFIGHVSIWLVSWITWRRSGVWIVGEHDNTPGYHLSVIDPNDQCWCRSGKKYRKCHMHEDQRAAAFRRWR